MEATIPTRIPDTIGTILKNPFAYTATSAVARIVMSATMTNCQFIVPPSGTTKPALEQAEPARPRPITAIIGPTTIGGKILLIQLVPIRRIRMEKTT